MATKPEVAVKTPTSPHFIQDESGQWWYTKREGDKTRRTRAHIKVCERCGEEFVVSAYHNRKARYCSSACANKIGSNVAVGPLSRRWKGGRRVNAKGYVEIWVSPEERERRGRARHYILEHVLVKEEEIGRLLLDDERVHHKNGHKTDNRRANLELLRLHSTPGQSVADLVAWAREIIDLYGDLPEVRA